MHMPRLPVSAALNMPAPPLASPSNNMYSGPPPPYSYPTSTASSIVGHGGYISPTEPRKIDDDKEPPPSHRHSLPSIHEALATESPLSITSLLQKSTPLQIQVPPNQNHSPTTVIPPRTYPETPRGHPNLLTQPSPTGYFRDSVENPSRPQYSPRASNESVSSRLPGANPHDPHHSILQPSRTVASPTNPMRPASHTIQPQHTSPIFDRTPRPHPPPQTNSHYPYNSYPAPYSYPPPSASIAAYPALQHPSWRPAGGAEIDRAEEVRRAASKGSPRASQYGESVKRHLDIFDLETSLNEVGHRKKLSSPVPYLMVNRSLKVAGWRRTLLANTEFMPTRMRGLEARSILYPAQMNVKK